MGMNLVAFSENQDAGAAYVKVAGVADPITVVSGDIVYVPSDTPYLIGALACIGATSPIGAYLQAPSLRAQALYDIDPCMNGLLPTTGKEFPLHPTNPLPLVGGEGLEALLNSDPGAAEVGAIVPILSDGPLTPVSGEIFSVKFTAAITETVSVWTNGAITLRQTLPVGRYQVVGAKMFGTSGVAFRFVPKGESIRPGGPCCSAIQDPGHPLYRNGGLGVWFEFDSRTPPSVDWLASATSGTSQTGILDLIRVA